MNTQPPTDPSAHTASKPPTHWLAREFGLPLPILQAPLAGAQDHVLALAVAQAGGLGAIPAAMLSPAALRVELAAFRAGSTAPLNVNFFCHTPPTPDDAAQARWLAALQPHFQAWGVDPTAIDNGPGRLPFTDDTADLLAEFRPEVVSFHFGLPAPRLLAAVRAWGATVIASATTVDEALWLQDHGVDAIIAQGLEAGGHRGHFLDADLSRQMGLFALLPQVARAVSVPVIAAGGVSTPQAVAAARALGAQAVQVGTAYLLSPEATTRDVHRLALCGPHAHQTALTRLLTGRPARGLWNQLMHDLGPLSDVAPAFPLATAALAPLRAAAEQQGRSDFSPLWAGQGAAHCTALPAADITRQLASGWTSASS
ncbi:MAG: nitronate monooxygenase [Burkholderiales bacterium]|nr:nitronate monooxygenase [Burkholderiales bacterium]